MRRTPEHGRPIRDQHVTVGWLWLERDGWHCEDDRHGVETVHDSSLLGQTTAQLACVARSRLPDVRVAVALDAIIRMKARKDALTAEAEALCTPIRRLLEIERELEALDRESRALADKMEADPS